MLYFVSRTIGQKLRIGDSVVIEVRGLRLGEVELQVCFPRGLAPRGKNDTGLPVNVAVRCQVGQRLTLAGTYGLRVLGVIGSRVSLEVQTPRASEGDIWERDAPAQRSPLSFS